MARPADPRSEPWLPDEPSDRDATPRQLRPRPRAARDNRWFRRAGAEAALAGERREPRWDLILADHGAERRAGNRRVGRHQGRVDTDHVVQVAVGEPVSDTLGVTCHAFERALGRDPPIAGPGLPALADLAQPVATLQLVHDGDPEGSDDELGDRPSVGEHDTGRHDDLIGQVAHHPRQRGSARASLADGRHREGEMVRPGQEERRSGCDREDPDEHRQAELTRAVPAAGHELRDQWRGDHEESQAQPSGDETGTRQRPTDQPTEMTIRGGVGDRLHGASLGAGGAGRHDHSGSSPSGGRPTRRSGPHRTIS